MKVNYTHWEEGKHFLGYLHSYPDYWTQGETLEELKEHLLDLHNELSSGKIDSVRKVDELEIA